MNSSLALTITYSSKSMGIQSPRPSCRTRMWSRMVSSVRDSRLVCSSKKFNIGKVFTLKNEEEKAFTVKNSNFFAEKLSHLLAMKAWIAERHEVFSGDFFTPFTANHTYVCFNRFSFHLSLTPSLKAFELKKTNSVLWVKICGFWRWKLPFYRCQLIPCSKLQFFTTFTHRNNRKNFIFSNI